MDKGTIVRLVLFVLAWVNSFLASKGFKTIPVLDENQVALGITFAVSAYTFYKHNVFGKKTKEVEQVIVKESEALIEKVVNSKQAADIVTKVVDNQPTTPVQPVTAPQAPVANPPQQPVENNTTQK